MAVRHLVCFVIGVTVEIVMATKMSTRLNIFLTRPSCKNLVLWEIILMHWLWRNPAVYNYTYLGPWRVSGYPLYCYVSASSASVSLGNYWTKWGLSSCSPVFCCAPASLLVPLGGSALATLPSLGGFAYDFLYMCDSINGTILVPFPLWFPDISAAVDWRLIPSMGSV